MIIDDNIEILINKGNINKYKKLGYSVKENDVIQFPIHLLSKGSNYKVRTICENCNSIFKILYKKYNKNIEFNKSFLCSRKCSINNNIKKVKEYYGVNNISQIPYVKEKIRQTNIKKYKSEHYFGSEIGKIKIKDIIIERYGVDNYRKTDEYKEKTTKTNLEKYGVEWSLQSKDVREKGKITNLKKYGVEYSSQSKIVREAVEKTCYEKYGYKTNLLNKENINKVRKTNIERYGVDNPMKFDQFKNKAENTNLEKYGVSRYTKTDDGKKKTLETNLKKYGVTNPKKHESFRKDFIISQHKDYIKYIDNSISLFKCDKGHNFEIKTDNFFSRSKYNTPLCTICSPIGDSSSIKENELYDFICSVYDGEIIKSYRDKLEIDIYLPKLNIGFEFNGLYWHSEKNKGKNYHLDKTTFFKERGIEIIHIWEDDWDLKNNIIKGKIASKLDIFKHIINSNDCEVIEITDTKIVKKFLKENHLRTYVNSSVKLGLYYNGELVSLMLFTNKKEIWEISTYCNIINYNILGDASKLLNYLIEKYSPTSIITYVDMDWSESKLYHDLGFEMIEKVKPNYKFIFENIRINKKHSEELLKIWDCGKNKFKLFI